MTQEHNPNRHGGPEDPYETIKVIEAWGLDYNFNLGTAVKLIRSASNTQDIRDAIWYLEREISRSERLSNSNQLNLPNMENHYESHTK